MLLSFSSAHKNVNQVVGVVTPTVIVLDRRIHI